MKRELGSVSVALSLVTCAQAPKIPLPLVRVYDTRFITEHSASAETEAAIVKLYNEAYPLEMGACFYGSVVSVYDADSTQVWRLQIERVVKAKTHLADSNTVTFLADACEDSSRDAGLLLGIGHSHPHSRLDELCEHSWADAVAFATRRKLLISYVFCGYGRGEWLMRDGRRVRFRWSDVDG